MGWLLMGDGHDGRSNRLGSFVYGYSTLQFAPGLVLGPHLDGRPPLAVGKR
jgi:hypothetical protein